MSYDLENLNHQELLALALRENSVKELAEIYHTPRSLYEASIDDLTRLKGFGKKKALQVMAILELSRRIVSYPLSDNPIITAPSDLYNVMKDRVKLLDREHFFICSLTTKGQVLAIQNVSVGCLNQTIVHPREIFKSAIKLGAASIIACHNHPSGQPEPSSEDISVTRRLVEAGEIIGIKVLDHIIIGHDRFISFRERGLI